MTDVKQQKLCLSMMLLQFTFAGILYFLYTKYLGKQPVEFLLQCSNVLIVGGLLSLLSWRHSILARNAFIEKRDSDQGPAKENIFNNEVDMSGRQERAFTQFNKILLPIILIVLSLTEFFLSGRILLLELKAPENLEGNLLIPAAVLTALSIILFLSGKFMSGLSYDEQHHFLRPVSGYLLLGSFTLFLGILASLTFYFNLTGPLFVFVWGSIIISLLLSVERILLWIIDLYRPKAKNEEYIPVYESRILALFTQPRGVLGNMAAMLEYQFGIKVSESSFALFFKKIFIPYLCLQVISLFLLSSFTYIRPHEKGLMFSGNDTNFEVLDAGLHLTAPWPICTVERFEVGRVKEINLSQSDKFSQEYKMGDADLWNNESYRELMRMTAVKSAEDSDHNLVVANVKMKYSVEDVMKFRGSYVDGEKALKMYGQQLLSRSLLENDFNKILKQGLIAFAESLKKEIQKSAGNELGVDIVDLEFVNFQPPPEIADAYQAKLQVEQNSLRQMIEAERYAIKTKSNSIINADKEVKTAQSETVFKSMLLDARKKSFLDQLKAYKSLPLVYETQAMMIAFENWGQDVRKIINLTGASKEIINLELKKNAPDILNMEE